MSTLLSVMFGGNVQREARIAMWTYILMGLSTVWGGWLSVAPAHFSDITWKDFAALTVSTIASICTTMRAVMNQSWKDGQILELPAPKNEQ